MATTTRTRDDGRPLPPSLDSINAVFAVARAGLCPQKVCAVRFAIQAAGQFSKPLCDGEPYRVVLCSACWTGVQHLDAPAAPYGWLSIGYPSMRPMAFVCPACVRARNGRWPA